MNKKGTLGESIQNFLILIVVCGIFGYIAYKLGFFNNIIGFWWKLMLAVVVIIGTIIIYFRNQK